MSNIDWNKIPEKRREKMMSKLVSTARKLKKTDLSKPARTGIVAKAKFYIVRMMQTGLGKQDPEYVDYKYWKQNGWIDKERPWKR